MTRFYLKQPTEKSSTPEDTEELLIAHQPTLKELMDEAEKRTHDERSSESIEQNNASSVGSIRPRFNQD